MKTTASTVSAQLRSIRRRLREFENRLYGKIIANPKISPYAPAVTALREKIQCLRVDQAQLVAKRRKLSRKESKIEEIPDLNISLLNTRKQTSHSYDQDSDHA